VYYRDNRAREFNGFVVCKEIAVSEPIKSYIRSAGIGAAVPNMVINPALAWVVNRQMEFVPLTGDGSMVVDTAITSILLPLIVTLFIASATRREIEAGRITVSEGFPRTGCLLSWLPRQGWALGLTIGIVAALVIAPLTLGFFRLLGVAGLPFAGFALFKAVYTPVLAFIVARWVVFRQLLPVPEA
jgi:hypothetical protein